MAASFSHSSRSRAAIFLFFAFTVRAAIATFSPTDCPTGFVNFGDGLTDTGNAVNLFPYYFDCENPPYGETFFGKPAKRFCDGRLVPDFFSLAFRKPLLDPYIKPTSYEYQYGINFAESAADATANETIPATNSVAMYPYQLNQFKRFFNNVVTTESEIACANFVSSLPFPVGTLWVSQWLFTINTGGNDFINAITAGGPNPDLGQIQATVVPNVVGAILATIKELYAAGARKFLIFGIAPQGCLTLLISTFPVSPVFPRDGTGCIIPINNLIQNYNAALLAGIQALQPSLPGANVAFFDYYAATLQIYSNPGTYGFTNTLSACCGAPGFGSFNYNPAATCGRPGSTACPNPDQYTNWDGRHGTDAFYRVIATFALNGQFTIGGVNYASKCFLDFSKFPSSFTFNQVYPLACQTIFV